MKRWLLVVSILYMIGTCSCMMHRQHRIHTLQCPELLLCRSSFNIAATRSIATRGIEYMLFAPLLR